MGYTPHGIAWLDCGLWTSPIRNTWIIHQDMADIFPLHVRTVTLQILLKGTIVGHWVLAIHRVVYAYK